MFNFHRYLLPLLFLLPAAWLGLEAADTDTNKTYVLQAFRAENAFIVTPGETRTLRVRVLSKNSIGPEVVF